MLLVKWINMINYGIFFVAFSLQSVEDSLCVKLVEAINQSTPVHYVNKAVGFVSKNLFYSSVGYAKEVHPFLNSMGKKAMMQAMIPADRHVPFFKLPATDVLHATVAGYAKYFGIYLNEEVLRDYSYGNVRFTVFHETMHAKYNDDAMIFLIDSSTFVSSFSFNKAIASRCIKRNPLKFFTLFNVMAAGSISTMAARRYAKFCEGRADQKAVKFLQCSQCTFERALYRNESVEPNGYLTGKQLMEYNKFYNPQNSLCDFHTALHKQLKNEVYNA